MQQVCSSLCSLCSSITTTIQLLPKASPTTMQNEINNKNNGLHIIEDADYVNITVVTSCQTVSTRDMRSLRDLGSQRILDAIAAKGFNVTVDYEDRAHHPHGPAQAPPLPDHLVHAHLLPQPLSRARCQRMPSTKRDRSPIPAENPRASKRPRQWSISDAEEEEEEEEGRGSSEVGDEKQGRLFQGTILEEAERDKEEGSLFKPTFLSDAFGLIPTSTMSS